MILGESDTGCYGNLNNVDTTGASRDTASQDGLSYSGNILKIFLLGIFAKHLDSSHKCIIKSLSSFFLVFYNQIQSVLKYDLSYKNNTIFDLPRFCFL